MKGDRDTDRLLSAEVQAVQISVCLQRVLLPTPGQPTVGTLTSGSCLFRYFVSLSLLCFLSFVVLSLIRLYYYII